MTDRHPARGKIDLSWHKMAGVYRAPAMKRARHAVRKDRGEMHRQLWRLVDGAVRDAFACHPDYLTPRGQQRAAEAVTKRVTGSLFGYATQVARGRSGAEPAAETTRHPVTGPWSRRLRANAIAWARTVWIRAWAGRLLAGPKFMRSK